MTPEEISAKLPEWLAANFAGRSKPELRMVCQHLEIGVSPSDSIDSMTRKLLQHYDRWDAGVDGSTPPARAGAMADRETRISAGVKRATKSKPAALGPVPFGSGSRRPPRLTSLSKWQGQRFRIRALPQDQQRGGARRIPVGWEGEVFLLDPKLPYQDVPAPIFYNIADSQAKQLILEWNSQAKDMDRSWHVYARFPIQFMGPTPGTEHLPSSLSDWLQRDARANDLYANEGRDTLERVWGMLTDGARPNDRDRDREIGYWRREILQLLGLTPEQLEPVQEEAEA
ncbi:MAG: hypothetical protein IPK64_19870 [bacterium]|nr:hypothetical protein [bacterium]